MEIIKKIISEERCIDELTGQVNPSLVKVNLVVDNDGQLNTYEKNFSVHIWEYFKEQGTIL
ncbi:hypothetical protein [Bacillus cereus group sp. TH152-1LC]|uniref:hypothetical protein n=1 Tax=Bacillus cereus group sp. TH152-1LC TaxID=3018060 RepID=UPI0022E1CDCF|nr:hypothetical protein [Bacillus cereus group sp. TH152-1LC]MDA1675551.1 hypothetical protein [Bacillus cereus group sp. TH152-1LC]